MNLEQFKNMTVGKRIGFGNHGGYGVGGECGELASYWFSEITLDKFQFAYGKPNINAAWAIGSDCYTAWNVATQANWGAMGFDKIDNPSFSQLKAGDIFFISARAGLSTGHVGIVYSTANNNVTTLEQNFGGARYVQLMAGANSWSYYGGFSCIVRPKQPNNTNNNKPKPTKKQKGFIQMFVQDNKGTYGKKEKGAQYVISSTGVYHVSPAESKVLTAKIGAPLIIGKDINEAEIDIIKATLIYGKK